MALMWKVYESVQLCAPYIVPMHLRKVDGLDGMVGNWEQINNSFVTASTKGFFIYTNASPLFLQNISNLTWGLWE